MCDTQVLIASNGLWFAKNSDREPHEPQIITRHPAVRGDRSRNLRTTYLQIPQVPVRHAIILSKPAWLWGAEMGFNEHGLVIGNEAVFTRQRSIQPALLGMDLLRLALERAANCRQAIEVIGELLHRHGQGGPAGYADRHFHYDSSFMLADFKEAWILETAGRQWAAVQVKDYGAISNALSLEREYTVCAAGVSGSFRRHDTRILPHFAASRPRRELSLRCLREAHSADDVNFSTMTTHLRRHAKGLEDPLRGSNADLCMHATGPVRRSQTTGSMVVWLGAHGARAVVTGTSAPCLSLFRPIRFGPCAAFSLHADDHAAWQGWQKVQRAALFDSRYRQRLRQRIKAQESTLLPAWMQADADFSALDRQAENFRQEILAWSRPAGPRHRLSSAQRLWWPAR